MVVIYDFIYHHYLSYAFGLIFELLFYIGAR